jgi:hypothetical protein
MSIGSLNQLSNNSLLQSILTSAVQGTRSTTNSTSSSLSTSASSLVAQSPDDTRLSPFAQLITQLQQLQQSDPAKYQQVTQQIATSLQNAAQTATAAGDTKAAAQLNKLATDFTNASKSGQLPDMQDLAQAVDGNKPPRHRPLETPSDDSTQLLSAYQAAATKSAATDPVSIIMSTLASGGVTDCTYQMPETM